MGKMKRMFVRLNMLLAIVLMFALTSTVSAQGFEDLGKVADGSLLTDEKISQTDLMNLARGNILNQGSAQISNKGNGVVNVYGAVFGSVVCDKLMLYMTLQRYETDHWVNVQFFEDEVYNKASLSKSYNVSVKKGYYYRNKAACVAWKGSTTESKDPITNGIWID